MILQFKYNLAILRTLQGIVDISVDYVLIQSLVSMPNIDMEANIVELEFGAGITV